MNQATEMPEQLTDEEAYLLRSPKNAERLLQALARSERGEGIPMTIEELRAAVGFDETENDEENKGS